MQIQEAIGRALFEAFVEQVLAPTLNPDDIVVMDNLSVTGGIACVS